MSGLRIRSVLLATLTLLFGLHTFRVFLSVVIWYLGQRLNGPQLALYALATFAMALLTPLVRRFLGGRGGLALTAGGLSLVRLAIQVHVRATAPPGPGYGGVDPLGLVSPAVAPIVAQSSGRSGVPVLAVAFSGIRSQPQGGGLISSLRRRTWHWGGCEWGGLVPPTTCLCWPRWGRRTRYERREAWRDKVWPF